MSAFAIIRPGLVRGDGKEKLKAGLIVCGGRGTTATFDLLAANGNVELVAMADVFEDHLEKSLARLRDPKGKLGGVQDRGPRQPLFITRVAVLARQQEPFSPARRKHSGSPPDGCSG